MKIDWFLERPLVKAWWDGIQVGLPKRGSDLVEALGTPTATKAGLADNVAIAEDILKGLLAEGHVVKGDLTPSLSQKFFGAGGLDYRHALRTGNLSLTFFTYARTHQP